MIMWVLGVGVSLLVAGAIYYLLEYRQPALITQGEVCDKKHTPAHETNEVSAWVGAIPLYTSVHKPESWLITFGKKNKNGDWKTRSVEVKEDVYNKYEIGDQISFRF